MVKNRPNCTYLSPAVGMEPVLQTKAEVAVEALWILHLQS